MSDAPGRPQQVRSAAAGEGHPERTRVVVVGAGHAAAQLCASLAERRFEGTVSLVGDEAELPYHRPPLSKTFIKTPDAEPQRLRGESAYADAGVALHLGDGAVSIDRAQRHVQLRSGAVLPYDVLVLATGARARNLPGDRPPALVLRHAADARALRQRLAETDTLTVIGGGFIGLELAASARQLGKDVQVLEAAPRLLARVASPEVSAWLADWHRAQGVRVHLGARVGNFETAADGRDLGLVVDGAWSPCALALAGIGAHPETELATAAGLRCENGIVVDRQLRTVDDPAIYAIGDCASFIDVSGHRLRLESVQNANDQARCVATSIATGQPQPYAAAPWFWSEQGSVRLQIAGLLPADGERYRRDGRTPQDFSILHYQAGRLRAVESVNAALDHMAARKLLEQNLSPAPADAIRPDRPLKSFL